MAFSTSASNTYRNGGTSPTVSVVIPALNEERNLPHVFAKLPAGITEVILVDGGSVDRTVAVARELRPDVVVVNQTRTGKGNALACGFAACTGDIIVMIDADGSTDPAEIPLFVEKLIAGADFVKGSRFDKGGHSHDITRLRKAGNDGLNLVVNVLFGTRFTDLCYGYNAFWRSVVPMLDLPAIDAPRPADGSKLWGDGFEIETMINIRAAAEGMRVGEVGSIEHARIHGESNLNTFRDGFRVLRTIFNEYGRMRRRTRPTLRPTGSPVHQIRPEAASGLDRMVNRAPAVAYPVAHQVAQQVADRVAQHSGPTRLNRAIRFEELTAGRRDVKPVSTWTHAED